MQRRVYLMLMLVLLLVVCAYGKPRKPGPGCEEIATLRAQIGSELSPDSFREWVAQTYRLPLESITMETRADGQHHVIRWGKHDVSYTASLERLVLVHIGYSLARTSADRVIACLGEPEWYSAQYKWDIPGNQLGLDLIFPEQGVLVHGWRFFRSRPKQPPAIDGHFPILSFIFEQPTSAEQILYEIYGGKPSGLYEQVLQEYKPWPGEWEEIVIEIDPSLQQ